MAVAKIKDEILGVGLHYFEFAGKTGDTKPVRDDICTGSKYFDIQTGKTYYYDSVGTEGNEWIDPTAT